MLLFIKNLIKSMHSVFPSVPGSIHRKSVIKIIGEKVGRVIKLDDNTGSELRGRFVRLAVMVDLYKPLVSKIKVDGWV